MDYCTGSSFYQEAIQTFDLKNCIGTFEFGLVPRSLFALNVSLLLVYDKAPILHHLEKYATSQEAEKQNTTLRVIIFNGMALVNSVSKTDNVKTCHDFTESFLKKLINLVANYDKVRLVFDRYLNTSKNK